MTSSLPSPFQQLQSADTRSPFFHSPFTVPEAPPWVDHSFWSHRIRSQSRDVRETAVFVAQKRQAHFWIYCAQKQPIRSAECAKFRGIFLSSASSSSPRAHHNHCPPSSLFPPSCSPTLITRSISVQKLLRVSVKLDSSPALNRVNILSSICARAPDSITVRSEYVSAGLSSPLSQCSHTNLDLRA